MDASKTILISIVGTIVAAFLIWFGANGYKKFQMWADSRKIYNWLKENTDDEPGETHKSLMEISDGTRIPEERARAACLYSQGIFQSLDQPGLYSIWRKEPQSTYEKRGLFSI